MIINEDFYIFNIASTILKKKIDLFYYIQRENLTINLEVDSTNFMRIEELYSCLTKKKKKKI